MKNIARFGDFLGHGGTVGTNPFNQGTVFVEGIPMSVFGDIVSDHTVGDDSHDGETMTITFSPNVFAYGVSIIRNGDPATCGGNVIATSIKTFTP